MITTIPEHADGIVEGRTVWVPTCGRGTVISLTPTEAVVDIARRAFVVTAVRRLLIPADIAEALPAAVLSNDWGTA